MNCPDKTDILTGQHFQRYFAKIRIHILSPTVVKK